MKIGFRICSIRQNKKVSQCQDDQVYGPSLNNPLKHCKESVLSSDALQNIEQEAMLCQHKDTNDVNAILNLKERNYENNSIATLKPEQIENHTEKNFEYIF